MPIAREKIPEIQSRGAGVLSDYVPQPAICSSAKARQDDSPVLLNDVVINHELIGRPLRKVDRPGEIAGMYSLATVFSHGTAAVLKRLAKLALNLCSAGSSGVSVIEGQDNEMEIFRWQALAGELEGYEGGTSPREWSPCGECLKMGKAMLYSYPARYFTYFQKLDTPIVEGLVLPMYVDGLAVGTIWIVAHDEECKFDSEDVRIMASLGTFGAGVLRPALCSRARAQQHVGNKERDIVWEEYIRRIAQRDQFALAALMDETGREVFATAVRFLSLRQDAEEIAADVYAHVWRAASTYDAQRGTVGAWLRKIASNRAIDRLRKSARSRTEIEFSERMSPNSIVEADGIAMAFETEEYVRDALERLPFEQRRAIDLAYFSGLSMPEIAEYLGHPLGTVKTRIRKGLIGLRADPRKDNRQ